VTRGEVWRARLEEEQPVVLLSGGDDGEPPAMRIVPPATADEKRGFVILSGEEACDIRERNRIVAAVGDAVGGVGVEVEISAPEGLPGVGVCGSHFLVTAASSAPGFRC
jgi:mRNA interferase MazF